MSNTETGTLAAGRLHLAMSSPGPSLQRVLIDSGLSHLLDDGVVISRSRSTAAE